MRLHCTSVFSKMATHVRFASIRQFSANLHMDTIYRFSIIILTYLCNKLSWGLFYVDNTYAARVGALNGEVPNPHGHRHIWVRNFAVQWFII